MEHLRMELHGVGFLAVDLEGGVGDTVGRGDHPGSVRQGGNRISVGHPDLRMETDAFQQGRIRTDDIQHGAAVFPGEGPFDLAAVFVGEVLGSVADAEQREFSLDRGEFHLGCIGIADRAGTAGKDDALDTFVEDGYLVIGVDFAKDIEFPQPAADQLGHLGPGIENDDPFCHVGGFGKTKIRQIIHIVGGNP